jgi:1-acyl-sn-glycerol-3-phosphate acyltransferase
MIWLRSLLWAAVFYLWSAIVALAMVPIAAGPRRWTIAAMRTWAWGLNRLIRPVAGITVEFRGMQYAPKGAALVAAKHQCMYDTMGPFEALPDFAYVMKQELLWIPFYGWYSLRAGMLAIDRGGHSKTLRKLMADARRAKAQGRQIVIFPEGTRKDPGAAPDYQPGVAGLYRDLGLPCTPLATNSGMHWPAHGFIRKPGTIVFEFLEPIPAGLHRKEFMRTLEERLEAASTRLLNE